MPKIPNNIGIFCHLALATDYLLSFKYYLIFLFNILCSRWEIPELGKFPLYSVVIMVIKVVICQARASRPTSRKPRVLHILMEDLYMVFILFIYLICFINLLF